METTQNQSHILAIGLNHQTAPIEVRDRVAISQSGLKQTLGTIRGQLIERERACREVVVLSTCNRFELYAFGPPAGESALVELISRVRGIPVPEFEPYLYRMEDRDATTHLLRVASGLDSMVLGESQVLGQVASAFSESLAHQTVGPVLSRLFQQAVHTGKRARTETAIGVNPASIGSVAVRLAEDILGDLSACTGLVIGAGAMGEEVVEALRRRGMRGTIVANRTYDYALRLARRWEGRTATFERLQEALVEADIVIVTTGAPHHVVLPRHVEKAMDSRKGRPMLIIDIALPRNVSPEVAQVRGVTLRDIDSLESVAQHGMESRKAEIPRVEAIIEEEVAEFQKWLGERAVSPTISRLQCRAEEIRQRRLRRALNRLEGLSGREQGIVESMSRAIVRELLHEPIMHLKEQAALGNGIEYSDMLWELFGLEGEE